MMKQSEVTRHSPDSALKITKLVKIRISMTRVNFARVEAEIFSFVSRHSSFVTNKTNWVCEHFTKPCYEPWSACVIYV